jgi:plastocyanin
MFREHRIAKLIILSALALVVASGAIAFASVSVSAQQSGGSKVSIVEGASTMTDKAFDPSPANVKAGDTVTWTNDDSTPHTVTSGTGSSDPNMGKDFDSSPGLKTLLSPKQTFDHKFDTAGEFAYFCQVHPTMVGKVVVS